MKWDARREDEGSKTRSKLHIPLLCMDSNPISTRTCISTDRVVLERAESPCEFPDVFKNGPSFPVAKLLRTWRICHTSPPSPCISTLISFHCSCFSWRECRFNGMSSPCLARNLNLMRRTITKGDTFFIAFWCQFGLKIDLRRRIFVAIDPINATNFCQLWLVYGYKNEFCCLREDNLIVPPLVSKGNKLVSVPPFTTKGNESLSVAFGI